MSILNKLKHISRIYVGLVCMFVFACIPIILGLMLIVWIFTKIFEVMF